MRTIYKYPLAIVDEQTVEMPLLSRILCVQMQDGVPCLWALVDPGLAKVDRIIRIVGTGNPFKDCIECEARYIGTVQERDFVWHVFEKKIG